MTSTDDTEDFVDEVADEAERFLDEYLWLRSFGKSDAAIAYQLGTSDAGLIKRLKRAGVQRADLSPDHEVEARLQELIAAQKPFDVWSFAFGSDPALVAAAISIAVRRGLVVRIGTYSQGPSCRRVGVFQETSAAAAAAAAAEKPCPELVELATSVVALARATRVVA